MPPGDWRDLPSLYIKLCKSEHFKIRKTLAHSIHEIATIMGQEETQKSLVKVMKGFLKDQKTDVRHGAMKNLHVFMKVISPEERKEFLKIIINL